VVCGLPPPGRPRRAKPSSPVQDRVQKLYLPTELLSTFVAHAGLSSTVKSSDLMESVAATSSDGGASIRRDRRPNHAPLVVTVAATAPSGLWESVRDSGKFGDEIVPHGFLRW
jgi:hypothetical protein